MSGVPISGATSQTPVSAPAAPAAPQAAPPPTAAQAASTPVDRADVRPLNGTGPIGEVVDFSRQQMADGARMIAAALPDDDRVLNAFAASLHISRAELDELTTGLRADGSPSTFRLNDGHFADVSATDRARMTQIGAPNNPTAENLVVQARADVVARVDKGESA